MQARLGLLSTIIVLWISQAYGANFTFDYGEATQCGDFAVSWSGGQAPYELTLIPQYDRPYIYSIPSSSYSNGDGSYKTQLTVAENTSVLAIMSDANGFGTGGVSEIITVGAGSSSCNTTVQSVDYYFDTDMALDQCREYSFSAYTGAVQPINITGVIPGGTTFVLNPPVGSTEFDWTADLASGTSVLFFMTDSEGRSGGSTQIDNVGISDDNSCLTGSYPSSVANHPSATSSSISTSSSVTSTAVSDSTKSTASGGTIAGAVVGGMVGAGIIAGAFLFFLLRRRRNVQYFADGEFGYRTGRRQKDVDLSNETDDDMPPAAIHPYPFFNPADGAADNRTAPHSTISLMHTGGSVHGGSIRGSSIRGGSIRGGSVHDHGDPLSTALSLPDPFAAPTHSRQTSMATESAIEFAPIPGYRDSTTSASRPASATSAARRKAAMAGTSNYQSSPRFILHTDAEEVIELPPQYSSLRPPTSPVDTSASGTQSAPPDAFPNAPNTQSSRHAPSLSISSRPGHSSRILEGRDIGAGLPAPM
ncbi:uncharacterized protein LAESUDRAFT_759898 [Laetiporus sulphureus 93-53]|uniref:Mid2 domain-containing protein n=1 Tax=Laetiporus sulphureus 93-53 TaxID=1314785 RepID=A0A165E0K3_9APHY|nr:uncharacterized protein LAESUDRAFT_759898 [Laetiporus sulphureus 93-53]KZT06014.1 hypothetical protein LAESUDRAFT_759898 [Laetiporus sulphureus 93-53]